MEANVEPVDFGREKREAARAFARLLGIVETHEAAIRADPVKYWKIAGEEISRLRLLLDDARDSLRPTFDLWGPPSPAYLPPETITVMKDELERLRACARIIEKGYR
ncbi:hypothetical protein [Methylocaldum sp.]|uniref:hypothetical protein n=1 Tax=Methylocaldum sp. TaxID=1969727 RepID=UPI002D3C5352|nr:hypothetical protein [Methylocaldum sp.]HYE38242.1 hypothetical protein [Methylocaldum sp.]